ncbi:MAG: hypothetical protein K2H45_06535, partial [Acetatifactor sp.]|nr:hypothetical protein [Acetatifactor sp.]
ETVAIPEAETAEPVGTSEEAIPEAETVETAGILEEVIPAEETVETAGVPEAETAGIPEEVIPVEETAAIPELTQVTAKIWNGQMTIYNQPYTDRLTIKACFHSICYIKRI